MADQDWNVTPGGRSKAEPTLGPSPSMQAAPEVDMSADPEFEPIYQPRPRKRWGFRFLLVFLLLLGGGSAAAWYYFGDLLFIDPDQEVPLVRAEGDPIKIRPESPGGMEIPDRDKLVYDRIPGAEERQPVERLLPPPETPLPRPTPAPAPEGEGEAATPAAPDMTATPETATASTTPTPTPLAPPSPAAETELPSAQQPSPQAPAEAPSPQTSPQTAAIPPATEVPTAPAPTPAPTAAAPDAPAPAPAPPAPPSDLSREVQRKAAEVATRTPPPPTATPSGQAYQVQLAAVRARDRAEQEWARLRNGHKDLLGTLQLSVVRADLGAGKGVFYRLRVGPLKSEAVARDLCGKLAERKVPCLVVRPN